jgi:hypothetical protein
MVWSAASPARGARSPTVAGTEARLTALKAIQPKLGAFYASLDDKQKQILEGFGAHPRHGRVDMDQPNGQDGASPQPDND